MICILLEKIIYRSLFTHVRSKIDARASNVSHRCRHRYYYVLYIDTRYYCLQHTSRCTAVDIIIVLPKLSCWRLTINHNNIETPLAHDVQYDSVESKPWE